MSDIKEEIIKQIVEGARKAGCELPYTEAVVRGSLVIKEKENER